MSLRRILVIEDEAKTGAAIELYLRHAGFRVALARSGADGLALARRDRPDLLILDLMLPGIDGLEICRALRAESAVPIIMLTARSTEEDKLRGLDLGADDYVTKPFSPRELVARVRAVLRRSAAALAALAADTPTEELVCGELRLDTARCEATLRGEPVALTPAELRLLAALMRAPGRVLTREQLLQRAFGESHEGLERTIDAHVKNLRRKIEEDRAHPRRLLTVFGHGYKLV
jgi:two-component system alkaline phosphatase synthesis response regulator PhoP